MLELTDRQVRMAEHLGRYMHRNERGCLAKVKHTEGGANREAERLRLKGETRIRAYQCSQCQHWHVGKVKQ